MKRTGQFGDRAFKWLTLLMALSIFVLIALIGLELFSGSRLALQKFGWHFLVTKDWDPVNEQFGALTFIFGTLVSSAIALIIAVPSVILGLWGIFVMVPFLRSDIFPWLQKVFSFLPFFKGPIYGVSMMAGGVIVAIMIIPIITSVSREILRSVPGLQREAAYALGATRWEVTRIAVLSYAKKGLFGAVILGLGRALGETMAVTMVIGNTPQIVSSLFAPGYTLASVIANEFTEATTDTYLSALFEISLVLLGVTVVVNALAQLLLKTFAGPGVKPQH